MRFDLMIEFFNLVKGKVPLSETSRSAFMAVMRQEDFNKGHLLIKPNTTCRSVFFVQKGLTRTLYALHGKDITDWFSPEHSIACSIVSFINQVPDRRGIELLEDSTLWTLDYDDMESLCAAHHDIERFFRFITAHGMLMVQERFDDLHFASAAERYHNMMK